MPDDLETIATVERRLSRAERELERALLAASGENRPTARRIQQLLDESNAQAAIDETQGEWELVAIAWIAVYLATANVVAARIASATGERLYIDQTRARVTNDLRENRNRIVSSLSERHQRLGEAVLVSGLTFSLPNSRIATELIGSSGMTAQGHRNVQSYRELLVSGSSAALDRELRDRRFDRTIEASRRNNRTLRSSEVDRMVSAYRERSVQSTAERTSTILANQAISVGAIAAVGQAIESEVIAAEEVQRVWITQRDAAVRSSHRAMDGQVQPEGAPFVSGLGNTLRYPGDPSAPLEDIDGCRCVLLFRLALDASPE